jgi:hypothetical protein
MKSSSILKSKDKRRALVNKSPFTMEGGIYVSR